MIEELHGLICRNQIEELKNSAGNVDLNQRTVTGDTLISSAIRNNSPEITNVLLEIGADPNFPDNTGWYPLHFAVQKENLKIVKYLVEYDANIDQQDGTFGNTPTLVAVAKTKGREFIDFFLNLEADVNIPNKRGVTVLDVANRKKISL